MTEQNRLDKAIALVKQFCPTFTISHKQDSKLHKFIGWVLDKIGNKKYMTNYITTIGQNCVLPIGNIISLWSFMLHEGRHAKDGQDVGNLLFYVAYLIPQLIGILGVIYSLAVGIGVFFGWPLYLLWGCLSLLFLLPFPSPGRAYIELRGYTVSLAVDFWYGGIDDEQLYIEWLARTFCTSGYYYMWPFNSWLKKYFGKKLQELKNNTFQMDAYLAACKVLCKEFRNC
jgi:hypothetical protein